MHSADVLVALQNDQDVIDTFGADAEILVPKTMVVGNSFDNFSRLALATTLDEESYKSRAIGKALRYRTGEGITHQGIETEKIAGRKRGECSVILVTDILRKFSAIHFSDGLRGSIGDEGVIAYSLGDQKFLCVDRRNFASTYGGILKNIDVKINP